MLFEREASSVSHYDEARDSSLRFIFGHNILPALATRGTRKFPQIEIDEQLGERYICGGQLLIFGADGGHHY